MSESMKIFGKIKRGKIRTIKHKKFLLYVTPKRDRLMLRLAIDYVGKTLFIRHAIGIVNGKKIQFDKIYPMETYDYDTFENTNTMSNIGVVKQ